VAAAVSLANNFPQAKMVVFTFHGTMALYVSHLRPQHAPIFAFTPDERVCRRLALLYGVQAQRMGFVPQPDENVFAAEAALLLKGLAEPGDHLVVALTVDMAAQHREWHAVEPEPAPGGRGLADEGFGHETHRRDTGGLCCC
jgi:pyruvate kinase